MILNNEAGETYGTKNYGSCAIFSPGLSHQSMAVGAKDSVLFRIISNYQFIC